MIGQQTQTIEDLASSDVLDSRDVIARIGELFDREDELTTRIEDGGTLTDEEREELAELQSPDGELSRLRLFADEASGYADWEYGATFVRDSYWMTYAQELAEDIGAIPQEYSWPASYIDWERAASDLQMDYSSVELEGVTFWTR